MLKVIMLIVDLVAINEPDNLPKSGQTAPD